MIQALTQVSCLTIWMKLSLDLQSSVHPLALLLHQNPVISVQNQTQIVVLLSQTNSILIHHLAVQMNVALSSFLYFHQIYKSASAMMPFTHLRKITGSLNNHVLLYVDIDGNVGTRFPTAKRNVWQRSCMNWLLRVLGILEVKKSHLM